MRRVPARFRFLRRYIGRLHESDGSLLWSSDHPMSAYALQGPLYRHGSHSTDVDDAFYAAAIDWRHRHHKHRAGEPSDGSRAAASLLLRLQTGSAEAAPVPTNALAVRMAPTNHGAPAPAVLQAALERLSALDLVEVEPAGVTGLAAARSLVAATAIHPPCAHRDGLAGAIDRIAGLADPRLDGTAWAGGAAGQGPGWEWDGTCRCGARLWYDERHDALLCRACDEWREDVCSDPHCRPCRSRPARPSHAMP